MTPPKNPNESFGTRYGNNSIKVEIRGGGSLDDEYNSIRERNRQKYHTHYPTSLHPGCDESECIFDVNDRSVQ